MLKRLVVVCVVSVVAWAGVGSARAQETMAARVRVAVLDFGATETGQRAAEVLSKGAASERPFELVDREQARAAARGAGYAGSLNMTLNEARDLASAIGCDYFVTGDAETLRRSSSARPLYYESYASVFLVSGRTGRLVLWRRLSEEAESHDAAERLLLDALGRSELLRDARAGMLKAEADERLQHERARRDPDDAPFQDEPEEGSPAASAYRPPQPFRRIRPAYTEAAAQAGAEATVDVSVAIDAQGEVRHVEIVRWAGYGLDESVIETVKRLHFRPAARDGEPFPIRVLLRYNFRRPPKTKEDARP
ncbi:MAG TPA: TonB family protein [Pyrinomonadaceae bacterium]|nr:TonB family protein [Pyrinomonadaceae bacterium]